MKKIFFFVIALLFIDQTGVVFAEKRPFEPEDLYRIKRVYDPQVSPDGKWIAYTISVPCLEENSFNSDIWFIPAAGRKAVQLTNSPGHDYTPRWSPDGKTIAFLSDRNGTDNIWIISFSGGEAKQLTHSETALAGPIWSKDGKHILCQSRMMPENIVKPENPYARELPLCEARTIHHLLYRQWDRWLGDKRNHLFLISVSDGSLKDVTPGEFDTPPVSLASGHDYDISPDGKEICYVKTTGEDLSVSTNHDLFTVSLESGKTRQITDNLALDYRPHYSPDGNYIAYCAMEKEGYESDTRRLAIYDRLTGQHRKLTVNLDRSVAEIVWNPNGKQLYFTAGDEGRLSIYTVDVKNGNVFRLTNEGYNTSLRITPDGKNLIFLRSWCHQPDELFVMPVQKEPARQLTQINQELLEKLNLPKLEEFWFTGANDNRVHGFLLKPPCFDENKKYPVVLTIHGGPQNMWADRFMTTWFTFPLIASPGYVGVYLNPRGSSGYVAKFREEVSRDYGGKCFEDLMAGLDYVIANYPFVDETRQAAIGGSFGGYSVNWIMGHTNRFKCLVSHAGLYNIVSFFGATEELWYPIWDMGKNIWDDKDIMEKWSPHNFANNFRTPTLVTHAQLDYRVPVTESFQLFTALQMQDIPSRMLYFPDEGHVIETPQNNVRWWKEIHRWFAEYLK